MDAAAWGSTDCWAAGGGTEFPSDADRARSTSATGACACAATSATGAGTGAATGAAAGAVTSATGAGAGAVTSATGDAAPGEAGAGHAQADGLVIQVGPVRATGHRAPMGRPPRKTWPQHRSHSRGAGRAAPRAGGRGALRHDLG